MNKIINWTIGSFFRTIGRIIAYIGIGILIAYIFNSSNFNWGGITDLFFDKVNALTLTNEVQKSGDTYITINQGYESEQSAYFINVGRGTSVQEFVYTFTNPLATENSDYASFSVILGIPQDITQTNQEQIDYDYCHRWNCTTFNSSGECQVYTCNQLYTNTDTTTHYTTYQYEIENLNIYARVYYDNGWASCFWQENELVCPTNNKKINSMRLQVLFNPTKSSTVKIGIERGVNYWKRVNIQGAIESQTQQQQQNHEETQNYLEDSNTTQAEEEASSFFEDFDAPDVGGLSAIITAPLNTIRSLLNSSCTNLVLPLPFVNKNLTLPCMNTIYTEHFGAFFTIYQTIVLALIAYRCIRSIFFDIHGFTNPNDDRIEVMDL